ncbi:MAG: energy transducer TonB [Candidatus Palauibacterales bacterium]|nr:energy transducer TonB [Candidatus Palauibacterales bacterium]MDP2530774.1 energy transducer TonB [Candidatus Palauibacterales bacterium]MDP2583152.1 energy transducer TonB [Candidatus Palauibacterales bacterium]
MAADKRNDRGGVGTMRTANDDFKRSYATWVYIGLIAAVAFHFGLVEFFPQLHAENMGTENKSLKAVQLPPEVKIPPPPKQIARPATPKVAAANVKEDVTIAPTTFEQNPVEQLPPPPKAGSPSDRPSFIPRDVDPKLENSGEIQRLLQRLYPPSLKDVGIGGRVVLWLWVDEKGQVGKTVVQESSGYDALDQAAAKVAVNMKFKPAINRDKPIGVWIAQPITFEVKR